MKTEEIKEKVTMANTIIHGLSIEKIENYDPLNSRAKANGMVTEWVGRNEWGNAVVFGNTKSECIAEARKYSR